MEKRYLIINIGSASKRYSLYLTEDKRFSAHFEIGKYNNIVSLRKSVGGRRDEVEEKIVNNNDLESAIEYFFNIAKEKGVIESEKDIDCIGFRIVAPGSFFRENKIIDKEYMEALESAKEKAPLHLASLVSEIKKLKNLLPDANMVGVSDSAFHSDLPYHSYMYSIPQDDAKKADIYRFGYHGISMQSVLRKIQENEQNIPNKIIVAHLGGGASVTAIKDGKSFDTSMGATPLEGLPMATRVGNIDAGALIQLAREENMDIKELNQYLNTKCGLFGLSGKTGHVKELLDLEAGGDKDASLALDIFVYNIKKYIGAYIASMGGLDTLVFSGTISERSSIMRARILDGLKCLGIEIDKEENNKIFNTDMKYIESVNSNVKIAVIKIDEIEEIAIRTDDLL